MVETRYEWQQPGYAERMLELFARNERARLADLALSERLGSELLAELEPFDLAA
jgi:hypothetical protein